MRGGVGFGVGCPSFFHPSEFHFFVGEFVGFAVGNGVFISGGVHPSSFHFLSSSAGGVHPSSFQFGASTSGGLMIDSALFDCFGSFIGEIPPLFLLLLLLITLTIPETFPLFDDEEVTAPITSLTSMPFDDFEPTEATGFAGALLVGTHPSFPQFFVGFFVGAVVCIFRPSSVHPSLSQSHDTVGDGVGLPLGSGRLDVP